MVATIDAKRNHGNLSSAIRLFVLDHFRSVGDSAANLATAGGRAAASGGG
jgi:predicted DNA-binding ribbon-helix-helix protein